MHGPLRTGILRLGAREQGECPTHRPLYCGKATLLSEDPVAAGGMTTGSGECPQKVLILPRDS